MVSRIAWQRRFGGRDDLLQDVVREFLMRLDPEHERDEVGEGVEPPAATIAEDPRDDASRRNRRY